MGDDTKDPGPFQQRGTPTAEPEDAVAESMDETMDDDLVATTVSTPTPNTNRTSKKTYSTDARRRRSEKKTAYKHSKTQKAPSETLT